MSPAKYAVQHDELDDVTTSPAPTKTTAPPPSTTRAVPEDFSNENQGEHDDDIDYDQKVSVGDGLERIAPKKGEVFRFAAIDTIKPKRKMVHYVALAGQKKDRPYLCSGSGCPLCRAGYPAKPGIVALIVQYGAADPKTGALDNQQPPRYRIGYLSMSAFAYNLLVEAPPEGAKVADCDLAISYDGERYGFKSLTTPPRYRARGDAALVAALAEPFLGLLAGKLGAVLPANVAIPVKPVLAEGLD